MDPTILAAIFTLFGVMIASGVNLLSSWLLLRRQREQWTREREAEKEDELRNRLQEIYSNCIFYLSKGNFASWVPHEIKEESGIEYYKLYFEGSRLDVEHRKQLQRWLNLLLIYHPNKDTPEFECFLKKMREGELKQNDIVEIAETYPRLRVRGE